ILNAFNEIADKGNASLATVAAPIGNALFATAAGLFAAIPAVVAYNSFVSRIRVFDTEMSNFSSDFLNIVKRHFFKEERTMGMGGRSGPPGRTTMSEINVTPMVDVMLVLLIIFMVTAPLIQQGVKVNLPEAKAAPIEAEEKKLVLSVDAQSRVFIGDA